MAESARPARAGINRHDSEAWQRSNAFNDSDVAIQAIAESGQGCLVGVAVVGGNGLFDTIELDQDCPLFQPKFIDC